MNATDTNTGSWKESLMRADLNNLYYNAFSADFRALFKPFNVLTAKTYNGSENETVQDYFTLFAEKEVFGSVTHSNATEAGALSQIKYYETSANRVKKRISSISWWERSPYSSGNNIFCSVNTIGSASIKVASDSYGIPPFGCI